MRYRTKLVVEAEKNKARMEAPQGRLPVYSDMVDDEFFHITCHVDETLRNKIEQSKFVELEKLILKDRPYHRTNTDNRMGLFTKDGLTYFVPAVEREVKINNVHQWEQTFRVYVAIYSKANPNRASEIWQYVHIINSAAATYQWSNVAEYDFTFRHLMAEYLQRSWAKTYLQGWNLTMREVIPSDSHPHGSKVSGFNKDNICWPYNKGKCMDTSCIKDHRCGYCGKWGHGIFNCRKKKYGQSKKDGTDGGDKPTANATN